MIFRGVCLAILFFATVVAVPPQRAEAGRGGKAIVIIGGVLGAAYIISRAAKRARRNKRKKRSYSGSRSKRKNIVRSTKARSSYSRSQVAQIQHMLNRLGFNAGDPDGRFGKNTSTAIKKFQREIGRRATGRLTKNERTALIRRAGGSNALASAPSTRATGNTEASLQPTSASPPETAFTGPGVAEFPLPQRYLVQSKWLLSGEGNKRQGIRTANACAAICDRNSCCQGFVYRGGQCTILKDVSAMSPTAQSNLSFVSGIKRDNSADSCRL